MNDAQAAHPSREQLNAFGLGQLSPRARAEMERHIADCAECCAYLESLPPDSLVQLVQASMLATWRGEPTADTHTGPAAATRVETSEQEKTPPLSDLPANLAQ